MRLILSVAALGVAVATLAGVGCSGEVDDPTPEDSVESNLACGVLVAGQQLTAGTYLYSCDGRMRLGMSPQGTLFLRLASKLELVWTSPTSSPGSRAVMQTDGNFVVYSAAKTALWNTHTSGHPGAKLSLQNDGNLVIRSTKGTALWNAGTRVPILVWADEFSGPLDMTTATHVGAWRPNAEWQDIELGYSDFAGKSWNINPNQHPAYTPFHVAGGVLSIQVTKTPAQVAASIGPQAPPWAGGILITNAAQRTFKYGFIEIRARLPNRGRGMFPALWLYSTLGSDKPKGQTEIDLLEVFGHPSASPWNISAHQTGADNHAVLTSNTDTTEFHVYAVDWQPTYLRFYKDGVLVASLTGTYAAYFNSPMSLRMNYSMNAEWFPTADKSDASTPSTMRLDVDYVRVYQHKPFL